MFNEPNISRPVHPFGFRDAPEVVLTIHSEPFIDPLSFVQQTIMFFFSLTEIRHAMAVPAEKIFASQVKLCYSSTTALAWADEPRTLSAIITRMTKTEELRCAHLHAAAHYGICHRITQCLQALPQ